MASSGINLKADDVKDSFSKSFERLLRTVELREDKRGKVAIKELNDTIRSEAEALATRVRSDSQNPEIDKAMRTYPIFSSLKSIISEASKAIDDLCKVSKEMYDARDMISWGRLRLTCFNLISFLGSNEERCAVLLPVIIDPTLDMLRSTSARTDFACVRVACNVVRVLSLSPKNRPLLWRKGSFSVMTMHCDHKDPNTSLAASVSLRYLCTQCERSLIDDAPTFVAATERLRSVFGKDPTKIHPMVRVELSRAVALLLPCCNVARKNDTITDKRLTMIESALDVMCTDEATRFFCYLLVSNIKLLHAEALNALKASFEYSKEKDKIRDTDFMRYLDGIRIRVGDRNVSVCARLTETATSDKAGPPG